MCACATVTAMTAARVVLVEHDAWLLDLLESGLRERGFVVLRAGNAAEALAVARAVPPECTLIDVDLPEGGYALASTLRAEPAPISISPIALLARDDDHDARTRAFDAGADVLLTRPFRIDEVVAQLQALVQLAHRMRARRNTLVDSLGPGPPSSRDGASFRADLAEMPIASLLALLEIERKSGTISVSSADRRAVFEIAAGCVSSSTLDGRARGALDTLREALTWTAGRVTFRASAPRERPADARPARALIAQAQRPVVAPPRPSSASIPRMGAIPPPPGQRKSLASLEAIRPRAPALEEQPTRRVDVPTVPSVMPPRQDAPATEPPPTTRRPT